MSKIKLHPTGLHPESLAAQVLDFTAHSRLGLLGLAAAADVVAAECRYNYWIASHVKGTGLTKEKWLRLSDGGEAIQNKCRAAMVDFAAGRLTETTLCSEFSDVTAKLNDRSILQRMG